MENEKSYRISLDGSKGYLITAHKKEHKCIMCEKKSKFGNIRSSKKRRFDHFICSDCLESFIYQYSKSAKTISLGRFIKDNIAWKLKENKAPNVKCRLCGDIIKITRWRRHLALIHHTGKDAIFRDFFIKPSADIDKAQKQWYNPDPSNPRSVPCGTKINGGPKPKVIFNAAFSNRKKF